MRFAGLSYAPPASSASVYRATRTAGSLGRNLNAANQRRLKLDDALTKLKTVGLKVK